MKRRDPVARLGLIAGSGRLPLLAARTLAADGVPVCAIGLDGLCDVELEVEVDRFVRHAPGELEAIAASLRAFDVDRVLVVGAVGKVALFSGAPGLGLDSTARSLLEGTGRWDDETLIRSLAGWLEARGLEVVRQDEALRALVARDEAWSARPPDAIERADIELGRRVLARVAGAGIGQSVVLRRGCVVAVEAVEGTDETIRRAGRLVGPGSVVVKGSRPGQDPRFDLPTIGPGTIEALVDAGASALAIEADRTLVIEREAVRAAADRAGIACTTFRPWAEDR